MDVRELLRDHGFGGSVGTATAAQVLTGYTFSNTKKSNIAGSMPNNGAPTVQPGQSLASGYYSGGTVAAPTAGTQTWTTNGTYSFTVPSGVSRMLVAVYGAGGGGNSNGPSGAGGGCETGFINVSPGESLSIIVGAGGVYGNPGSDGGTSSISNEGTILASAAGGEGASSSGTATGGVGGGHSGLYSYTGGSGDPDGSTGAGGCAGPGGNGSAPNGSVGGAGGPGYGFFPVGGAGGTSDSTSNSTLGGGGCGTLTSNNGNGGDGGVYLQW